MKGKVYPIGILLLAFLFVNAALCQEEYDSQAVNGEDLDQEEQPVQEEQLYTEEIPDDTYMQQEPPVEQPVAALSEPASLSKLVVSAGDPGQKNISLDIKGMDIVDVIKMLAARSGTNMVVGKNVSGRVTLFLKDVDIWSALEIVLYSNDLAYDIKDNIVNIMTQRDYELLYGERPASKKKIEFIRLKYAKASDLLTPLNQIKSNIGRVVVDEPSNTLVLMDTPDKIKDMRSLINSVDIPLATKMFELNYAKAEDIKTKVHEMLTKGVGSVNVDPRTNKIYVTDYPDKMEYIAGMINGFDEKTLQVLIDAQIIEVKPSTKFEMGVDWDYWIRNHFQVTSSLPIGTTSRLLLGTTRTAPAQRGDYKGILDLLRTIGDTKILSSPRIMVLNNQEAKILVGTKDAYITSSTSQAGDSTITSQTVNFVETGIKLFVTPTINKDNFVTMKIKPEVSSAQRTQITAEGQITEIPIVTTSEAETTVMVKDGITLVIGGLQKDQKTKTVKKIPIMGDVPLLGALFRSTSDEVTKTELVILLTPHIVTGEDSFTDFAQLKPKEGVVAKMKDGDIIKEKVEPIKEPAITQVNEQPQGYEAVAAKYYNSLSEKIKSAVLKNQEKKQKGKVGVAFTLSRDGGLIEKPYVFDADNLTLAAFVVKAIKENAPFEPFPALFPTEAQTFKISLTFE